MKLWYAHFTFGIRAGATVAGVTSQAGLLVKIFINKPGAGIIPVFFELILRTIIAGASLVFAGIYPVRSIIYVGAIFVYKVFGCIAPSIAAKKFSPKIIFIARRFACAIGNVALVLGKGIGKSQKTNNCQKDYKWSDN